VVNKKDLSSLLSEQNISLEDYTITNPIKTKHSLSKLIQIN